MSDADRITLTDGQRQLLLEAQRGVDAAQERLSLVLSTILAGANAGGRIATEIDGDELLLQPTDQIDEE